MLRIGAKRARHLLVWLHILTSVGWMSQALGLFMLFIVAHTAGDLAALRSALSMAEVLDRRLLLHLANASAFTGLMLSALTPWGYFRYWWVLAKLAITLGQFYVAIVFLGPNLAAAVDAAAQGRHGTTVPFVAAPLLMASAIAFQAWLSIAKPWKRTPWTRDATPPTGHPRLFVVATTVPVFDYVVGTLVGYPSPILSLLIVLGYPLWRGWQRRRRHQSATGW